MFTLLQLDGTEDLKFGHKTSKFNIPSKPIKKLSMLYLLHLQELIYVQEEKIKLLKDGILDPLKNQYLNLKLKVKLMILNSIQLTNGWQLQLIKEFLSGIFKKKLKNHLKIFNIKLHYLIKPVKILNTTSRNVLLLNGIHQVLDFLVDFPMVLLEFGMFL